ncbi:MAG: hypothetical protein ABIG45_02130, partial [Bacillota bacterium]
YDKSRPIHFNEENIFQINPLYEIVKDSFIGEEIKTIFGLRKALEEQHSASYQELEQLLQNK